ncbi:MAG: sulfite oxidase, partial [Bryobacteraceae bacterium]
NALWGGAQLAPLLQSADILGQGTEVVFWGADSGTETIRDKRGFSVAAKPEGSRPIPAAQMI